MTMEMKMNVVRIHVCRADKHFSSAVASCSWCASSTPANWSLHGKGKSMSIQLQSPFDHFSVTNNREAEIESICNAKYQDLNPCLVSLSETRRCGANEQRNRVIGCWIGSECVENMIFNEQ